MYVIAPIPHPRIKEILDPIPRNRLLLFDRYEALPGEVSHITQEFEQSSFEVFTQLADAIKKYKEILFIHSPDSLDPKEIVVAFKKFLRKARVKGSVIPEFVPGSIKKGTVYFTLDNFVMWEILKECAAKKMQPGKDIGILSHNDEPAKEFVGITTYSADFAEMGRLAAQVILDRKMVQLTVPMKLYRRKSL